MDSAGTGFWVATITAIVSALAMLGQLAYQALAYHRQKDLLGAAIVPSSSPKTRNLWLMAAFPLVAWLAVGFDYLNNHVQPPPPSFEIFTDWSVYVSPDGKRTEYYAALDTTKLSEYSQTQKAFLIVLNADAAAGKMGDTAIEKSPARILSGSSLEFRFSGTGKFFFGFGDTVLQFYLVLIPKNANPDDVSRLADVSLLGGKVVACVALRVPVQPIPMGGQ